MSRCIYKLNQYIEVENYFITFEINFKQQIVTCFTRNFSNFINLTSKYRLVPNHIFHPQQIILLPTAIKIEVCNLIK